MKVIGLVGSPRKNSNTDLIVTAILNGASKKHIVEKIYLYKLRIDPCVDCRACKKGSFQCVLDDDMPALYPKIQEADIIVWGTPLYWYGPSAKTKLFLDRLRPFISSGKLKGKKAVLAIPSEEGANACNYVVGMFNSSFRYLGIELVSVLLPKASKRAEIKKQATILDQAQKTGLHFS
jgi:multimeric flavodoxin WrbA